MEGALSWGLRIAGSGADGELNCQLKAGLQMLLSLSFNPTS